MKKILLAVFLSLFILMAPAMPVFAEVDQIRLGDRQPTGYGIKANDPNVTVGNLVSNGIKIAFIFASLAVLVFLIWGAFDWITSGGDKEKIAGARRKIANSLIGLVILALAAFIVSLFGQIVGIDPLNMGVIPRLGDLPAPAP